MPPRAASELRSLQSPVGDRQSGRGTSESTPRGKGEPAECQPRTVNSSWSEASRHPPALTCPPVLMPRPAARKRTRTFTPGQGPSRGYWGAAVGAHPAHTWLLQEKPLSRSARTGRTMRRARGMLSWWVPNHAGSAIRPSRRIALPALRWWWNPTRRGWFTVPNWR